MKRFDKWTKFESSEREQAEKAFNDLNEFNKSLLASLPFYIDVVDEKGDVLFMNKRFLSIFGNKSLGKKCWELYKDDKKQCLNCPLKKDVKIGETKTIESTGCLGGKTLLITHTGMVYRDKLAVLEVFSDITERKKIEEALRESEKRFRVIFNDAAIGITLADIEGHPVEVNSTFQKMIGYTRKELRHMFFTNFTHPEDVPLDIKEYEQMKKGLRDSFNVEKRYIRKDGQAIWVNLTVSLVRNEKGEPKFTVGVVRDITEHKKTDEGLKFYSKAVEEAPDGVQIIDLDGRIIYSNKAVEEIYGFSPEEYYGKNVNEMNADSKFADIVILPSVRMRGYWSGELQVKHKDGRIITIWLKAAMVKNAKGEPLAMIGIIRDVTERKELEKHKDDFISVATHELKTPLTSIKLFSQILRKRVVELQDNQLADLILRIDGQADKLINLVRNLLDATKLESGKITFKKDNFSLNNLIKEVTKDIKTIDSKHQILVEGKVKERIQADKYRISQVLMNLLTNALRHSPDSEKIIIRATPVSKSEVLVSVQDFGEGIPKYKQAHLFERFYQAHANGEGKEQFLGTGLGLYISSEIVKSHGGKIWMESQAGRGSTFYFTLPRTTLRGKVVRGLPIRHI